MKRRRSASGMCGGTQAIPHPDFSKGRVSTSAEGEPIRWIMSPLRGILYITNRRIIFQGNQEGFDVKADDLVAITPYSNCVELQTSKMHYKIFVPDGNVTQAVLQLIQ